MDFKNIKLEMNENTIFYAVIAFMVCEFLWEFYLARRQHNVYKKNKLTPSELVGNVRQRTFDKARLYALDKNQFHMFSDAFSLMCNVLFLIFDGLVVSWDFGGQVAENFGYKDNETVQSAACVALLNVLSTATNLPFSIYYTFVLEEKHGFNKQTAGFFIWDKIKMHILHQVIIIPLICGIIYIVKIGGNYFFIYLWLFVTAMTLFLYTIYPDYIAPLFDKYTVLPQGDLRVEIEKLAKTVGFPLYKLYIVQGSKRSAHSNAYFYGLFNKRIVLFDTLLKDYSPENLKKRDSNPYKRDSETPVKGCDTTEVLAVLSHELGHWKFNHVLKNIIIIQANLFLVFLVFGMLFRYKPLYAAFGFHDSSPVLIGLIIVLHFVCLPYFELLNFCVGILSRRFEFEADGYAKSLGRANSLKRALIKLNIDNLGFPIYDPLYSKWHHSHPPLLERLHALDKSE